MDAIQSQENVAEFDAWLAEQQPSLTLREQEAMGAARAGDLAPLARLVRSGHISEALFAEMERPKPEGKAGRPRGRADYQLEHFAGPDAKRLKAALKRDFGITGADANSVAAKLACEYWGYHKDGKPRIDSVCKHHGWKPGRKPRA